MFTSWSHMKTLALGSFPSCGDLDWLPLGGGSNVVATIWWWYCRKFCINTKNCCFPLSWSIFNAYHSPQLAFFLLLYLVLFPLSPMDWTMSSSGVWEGLTMCLPLYFFFFPLRSMVWNMRISKVGEGLACCYISWPAVASKVWTDICPIYGVIYSRLLTEPLMPLE